MVALTEIECSLKQGDRGREIATTVLDAAHAEAARRQEPWTTSTFGGLEPHGGVTGCLSKLAKLGQITRDVSACGWKADDPLSRRQLRSRGLEGMERGQQDVDGSGIVTHRAVDNTHVEHRVLRDGGVVCSACQTDRLFARGHRLHMSTRKEKVVAARRCREPLPTAVTECPGQVGGLRQHLAHAVDIAERPERAP